MSISTKCSSVEERPQHVGSPPSSSVFLCKAWNADVHKCGKIGFGIPRCKERINREEAVVQGIKYDTNLSSTTCAPSPFRTV